MNHLIDAIITRLGQTVPSLRFIDQNLGQMEVENPPVDYPCALIDVPNIDYTTAGQRKKLGDTTVEIELYFVVRSPTNANAPEKFRLQGQEHAQIVKDVYKALEGFSGPHFTGLTLKKQTRKKEYYPRGYTMTFTTCLADHDAAPDTTKIKPMPKIDVNQ